MEPGSVERAARRLGLVAWPFALAATVVAVIRVAQGAWPRELPTSVFLDPLILEHAARFLIFGLSGALLSGWCFIYGSRFLLAACGRPWRHRKEISRTYAVSASEAGEIVDRALATLLRLGYRVAPREPLGTDGWKTSAGRSAGFSEDPRKVRQSVEFSYSGGTLTLTHRYGKRTWDRSERGEREYQAWLLQSLARGADLDRPPLRLDGVFLLIAPSIALASLGLWMHGLPEEVRRAWYGLFFAALFLVAFLTPLSLLISLFFKRWTVGRGLYIPSILLSLAGAFLGGSGTHTWELGAHRESHDPEILVRAGISAWRDSQHSERGFPPTRTEAALRARIEIEARLIRLGPRALPALLGFPTRPPTWIDDLHRRVFNWSAKKAAQRSFIVPEYISLEVQQPQHSLWRMAVLRRIVPQVIPELSKALRHPDPTVRFNSVQTLQCWNRKPEARRALRSALADSNPGVRCAAIWALTYHGISRDRETERALIALIEDPCPEVRGEALSALMPLRPDETAAALLEYLPRSGAFRANTLRALSRSTHPAVLPTLVEAISDPKAGHSVRQGLWECGAPAIGPLLDRLDTDDEKHVLSILQSMRLVDVHLNPTVVRRLLALAEDPDEARSRTALRILAHAANPEARVRARTALEGLHALTVLWPLLDSGAVRRETLLDVLHRNPEKALGALLDRPWWAEDSKVAARLAELANEVPSGYTWRIVSVLASRSPEHLEPVLRARQLLGKPLSLDASVWSRLSTSYLLELSRQTEGGGVGIAAALSRRNEPRVAEALLRMLSVGGERGAWAAWALAKRRAPKALPTLLLLAEKEPENHLPLIIALGEFGSPRVVPVLSRILARARRSHQVETFDAAVVALARAGDIRVPELRAVLRRSSTRILDPLDRKTRVQDLATETLARMGEVGELQLLEAMKETGVYGGPILRALGKLGSDRSLAVIREALDSQSMEDRRNATVALGHRRSSEDIPRVVEAALGASNYWMEDAVRALQEITGRDFGARSHQDAIPDPSEPHKDRMRDAVRAWSERRSD